MNKNKNTNEKIDSSEELTPIGKIAIIIFFVIMIVFGIYNRIKENDNATVLEEKTTYKTNREILNLIKDIETADNYKEDIFITTDYTRKEIIINKNGKESSVLIRNNDNISKYYVVNNNYYIIDNNTPVKVEDISEITKDFVSLIYPETYSNIKLLNSKDYLEETYKIKRFNMNTIDLNSKISSSNNEKIKLDVNYNDKIESIKIDITEYYNYINNTNEKKVTYDIEFSDIGNINIDEIKLYNLQ